MYSDGRNPTGGTEAAWGDLISGLVKAWYLPVEAPLRGVPGVQGGWTLPEANLPALASCLVPTAATETSKTRKL